MPSTTTVYESAMRCISLQRDSGSLPKLVLNQMCSIQPAVELCPGAEESSWGMVYEEEDPNRLPNL